VVFLAFRSSRYLLSGHHNGCLSIWDLQATPASDRLSPWLVLEPTVTFQAHDDTCNGCRCVGNDDNDDDDDDDDDDCCGDVDDCDNNDDDDNDDNEDDEDKDDGDDVDDENNDGDDDGDDKFN
jgi:hypothetical protein